MSLKSPKKQRVLGNDKELQLVLCWSVPEFQLYSLYLITGLSFSSSEEIQDHCLPQTHAEGEDGFMGDGGAAIQTQRGVEHRKGKEGDRARVREEACALLELTGDQ